MTRVLIGRQPCEDTETRWLGDNRKQSDVWQYARNTKEAELEEMRDFHPHLGVGENMVLPTQEFKLAKL